MHPVARSDLARVVALADDRLRPLHRTRVFLTGGTGFIGSWVAEAIAAANAEAGLQCEIVALVLEHEIGFARATGLAELPGVRVVAGDVATLTPAELARQLGEPAQFDTVLHGAIHVDAATIARDPLPTLDSAIDGTRRVLDVARASGARRFLFVSSGAVYGTQPSIVPALPEDVAGAVEPYRAESIYAECKRIGETMTACYGRAYGIETIVARCFAFVGPRLPLDAHFAMGNFLRDALRGGPIVVTGDGTPVRTYMYAADLAEWLLVLLAAGTPGRAYNVGSPEPITLGEAAALVARVAGGVDVDIRTPRVKGSTPHRYVPSVDRARVELGLVPTVSLEDAVERTLHWHRSLG